MCYEAGRTSQHYFYSTTLRTLMRYQSCQWAGNWEPVRTSQLAQGPALRTAA